MKPRRRIEAAHPYKTAVSSVSVAELEYGVSKSQHIEKNRTTLHKFLSAFEILSFDDRDAESLGVIRAHLERMGTPIGADDLLIAAQAIARNIAVVTNNVREFERVPSLRVENWVTD